MLRLIHNQTVQGAILVDDIDDGLPNKTSHRLGSSGDPKAYKRDGYANARKQPCYVPRVKPTDATIAGYIDLNNTERVLLSSTQGKIAGLSRAGKITVVSLVASDLATPTVSGATLGSPSSGDVTIAGTNLLSVAPNFTKVRLFGAGVGNVTLTQSQITGAAGSLSNTSIVIKAALVPSLASGDSIIVTADDHASNTFVLP